MNGVHSATNPGALAPASPSLKFWVINAGLWSAYAGALMVPWLGRYPVLDMLPNKVGIAATGVAVTGALRALFRWLDQRPIPQPLSLSLGIVACLAGAFGFDMTVIAMTQGPDAIPLRIDGIIGSLSGGVPMPGRVGQYFTLLVAWSLGYHLFRAHAQTAPAAQPSTVNETSEGTLTVSGGTVRARDGSRTILLEQDEIDWFAADGDYVRIHCGSRNLLIRATMKHSSSVLHPLGFVRVHRSAIVNPKHVREIVRDGNDQAIVLRNGARIPVGRNHAGAVERLTG